MKKYEETGEALVVFDEEDVEERIASYEISLVGKLVSLKPINKRSLQQALANIWGHLVGFKVEEVGDKLFQFFLREEKGLHHVVQESPWIFRNSWLILK